MLAVFDGRQELVENMVIVCLDVSERLIIRILTQLNERSPHPNTYAVRMSFLMILWQRVLLLSSKNPNHAGEA